MVRGILFTVAILASCASAQAFVCHNTSVTGRLVSMDRIAMGGFYCITRGNNTGTYFGTGPRPSVTMAVSLANTSDTSKMHLGKLVTLTGDIKTYRVGPHLEALQVTNARVLHDDPFGR